MVKAPRILLLDTCGDEAAVGLFAGSETATLGLARGEASRGIVAAVERLLAEASIRLEALDAIGVVAGPGSFTGVRAGLAAAKGFSEAARVPLIAVSRLAVLAGAAGTNYAALRAGQGQLYLYARHEQSQREWLGDSQELRRAAGTEVVAVAGDCGLGEVDGLNIKVHALELVDALQPVLAGFEGLRSRPYRNDGSLVDANYVREESDIYGKTGDGAR